MPIPAVLQPPEPTPDWSIVLDDIPCPRCGYNLRELTSARCPECGLEFVWSAVIAAARHQTDSRLFEYQWQRRPVRSFAGTAVRLVAPWKFWREVPITLPVRVRSLCLQVGLACLIAMALLEATGLAVYLAQTHRMWYSSGVGRFTGPVEFFWKATLQFPLLETTWISGLELLSPLLAFGVMAWLAIPVFWQTRRNYRIRQDVILRTVLYPLITLILVWCSAYSVLALLRDCGPWQRSWNQNQWWDWAKPEYVGSCLALPLFYSGMGFAWRRYLQVRRGWGLVILVSLLQEMMLIAVMAIATKVHGPLHYFLVPFESAAQLFMQQFWPVWYWARF
jgi:hypothetical protein